MNLPTLLRILWPPYAADAGKMRNDRLSDDPALPVNPKWLRSVGMAWLAAAWLALSLPAAAWADVRILASPGGEVGPFLDLFARINASGERVVIDGPCLSACTLVLATVPANRICVTRRAVLGFHGARSIDNRGRLYAEPEASELVLASYPSPVRHWIQRRGGLTSRLLLLRGRDLAQIYPACR